MATYAVHVPSKWQQMPTGPVRLRPYWIGRGLKAFYLMRPGEYYRDMVTGTILGASVGTGPTFGPDYLQSNTSTANYATFPINFTLPTGNWQSLSVIHSSSRISGTVVWSLLCSAALGWTGLYSEGVTTLTTYRNSFDGSVTGPATEGGYAVTGISYQGGGNNLRAGIGGGLFADTTCVSIDANGVTAPTTMAFGLSRRGVTLDNASTSRMHYWGIADGVQWPDGELRALSVSPYGELFVPRIDRAYFDIGAATGNRRRRVLMGAAA